MAPWHQRLPGKMHRMQNDDIKKAKLRALKLLEKRDYTEAGLRHKLICDQYDDETVDAAVEYVRSYGYVDDLRYACNYVRCSSSTRSRRDIAAKLREKGVASELIDEALESDGADENEETELIKRLIYKKCPDPAGLDHKGRQKLYAYMYGKGFDIHRVEKILNELS